MINVTRLYCGRESHGDRLRYVNDRDIGPVVVFNCTGRCNLKCRHCYSFDQHNHDEMTTDQVKRLLTQLKKMNCPVVLFSGGEPLMRKDLSDLLKTADSIGLRTVLSTNGTLINRSMAQQLADYQVGYVGISIDGDKEFHDAFRGIPGSFDKALDGFAHCQQAGLKTGIRFTMTAENIHHVPFVFDLAAKQCIRRICFYHLVRTGRAKTPQMRSALAKQIRDALDMIVQKSYAYNKQNLLDEVLTVGNHADGPYLLMKMRYENHPSYSAAVELIRRNGGNRTAEKIVCVGWDGAVYPDQFWRNYTLGNICHTPLKEIMLSSDDPVLTHLREKKFYAPSKCQRCRWFDCCGSNMRFLEAAFDEAKWVNEPLCYLREEEIRTER